MNTALRAARTALLVLAAATASAVAQTAAPDPFHVTYQYRDLSASGGRVTGKLIVTVLNLSGGAARDVALDTMGPESMTFDHRELRAGNLANGQQAHRIEFFDAAGELTAGPLPDSARLTVRFTDDAGGVREAQVTARRLP
jgi:hypothetical protein